MAAAMLCCQDSCKDPKSSVETVEVPPASREVAPSSSVRNVIVISHAPQQADFKDRLARRLVQLGYKPWSADQLQGEGQVSENSLGSWLKKIGEVSVVGVIFVLSRAFSKSPQCLSELQYIVNQYSFSKGILPVMYEDFEMPSEMMFMIARHSYVVALPRVEAGDDLKRPKEVSEEWLTDKLRQGYFTRGFELAMQNFGHCGSSTYSTYSEGRDVWNPREMHQKLLQDLAADMNLNDANEFLGLVGIIGSTSFYNENSARICQEIGSALASDMPDTAALCTGGFTGAGETISRAFYAARSKADRPHGTYMVLPTTDPHIDTTFKDKAKTRVAEDGTTMFAPWDYGKTFFYGRNNAERMALMAVNSVLVMVEGGPGALQEALGCEKNKHCVIPVRCTGGAATNPALATQSPFAKLMHLTGEGEQRWTWVIEAQTAWDLVTKGEVVDPQQIARAVSMVVHYLFAKQSELDQCLQIAQGVQSVDNRPPGLRLLEDMEQLIAYMRSFNGVILFSGFGAKGQYADMEEVERIVDYIVKDLNEAFEDKWVMLYGGDPYLPNVKSIAHVARIVHLKHKKRVLAVQCDFYGNAVLAPSNKDEYAHMDGGALYMYKTEQVLDEFFNKKILFGGYYRFIGDKHEKLCGASSVWFGKQFRSQNFPNAHVIIGGGEISADDAQEGLKHHIPTFYSRTKLQHLPQQVLRRTLTDYYGQIEHWANANRFPREEWFPYPP